jgi:hypothetical protein
MLFDGRSADTQLEQRPLSLETWQRLARLLHLPELARDDLERSVQSYFDDIDARGTFNRYWPILAVIGFGELKRVAYLRHPGLVERKLVTDLADCVERHYPTRPNHGKKWLSAVTEACQIINDERGLGIKIGAGTIEGVLRGSRNRRTSRRHD